MEPAQVAQVAADAANQALAANNDPGKAQFKVPLFAGSDKDTVTPEQWVETLDRVATVNRWTDRMTADAANECLRGEAHTWKQNLAWNEDTAGNLLSWLIMKPLFLTRFK